MMEGFQQQENETGEIMNLELISENEANEVADKIEKEVEFLEKIKGIKYGDLSEEDKKLVTQILGHDKIVDAWDIHNKRDNLLQYRTASGPNGASFLNLTFPTGVYYEKSVFGKEMNNKTEDIKKLYYKIGKLLDENQIQTMRDHNIKQDDDREKIGFKDGLKPPHCYHWTGMSVIDDKDEKGIKFAFDKGKIQFNLMKDLYNNRWNINTYGSQFDSYILPRAFKNKRDEGINKLLSIIENEANNILK